MSFKPGDRVAQDLWVPGAARKKTIFGTVTKTGLLDMIGGPEIEVLWDGWKCECAENPAELKKGGAA